VSKKKQTLADLEVRGGAGMSKACTGHTQVLWGTIIRKKESLGGVGRGRPENAVPYAIRSQVRDISPQPENGYTLGQEYDSPPRVPNNRGSGDLGKRVKRGKEAGGSWGRGKTLRRGETLKRPIGLPGKTS